MLRDVLGLGVDQFTKLVLLPQGDFAAFLRADAETRRHLLERLFGTDRFAAVQQWLRESQAGLRQEVEAARERVAHLLARADQAGGTVGAHSAAEEPLDRLAEVRAGVAERLEEARAARVAAQERARHAVGEHQAALTTAALQARLVELVQQRARLRAGDAVNADRRARLAAAARAAGLARWLDPLAAARARSSGALAAMDAALVEVRPGQRPFRRAIRRARPSTEPARRRRYRTTPPCWSAGGPPSSWSANSRPSSARSPRRAP